MRKSKFSEEQIIRNIAATGGRGFDDERVPQSAGSAGGTNFSKWKAKFGGMDVSDARKLRRWRTRTPGSRSFWPRLCWTMLC